MASMKIACLGDPSDHEGIVTSTNADGTLKAGGDAVAVDGADHTCPIPDHNVTPITAITTKTYHNGKLILTEDAVAGCGAKLTPPSRGVFVE